MTMTLAPKRWYSWDYTVTSGDKTLATLDLSSWRERAEIMIDDVTHRVFREGAFRGDFVIERGGRELARATKSSPFHNTFIVHYNGRDYTLQRQSVWRRTSVLMEDDRVIGVIKPESAWSRRADADLPAEWPAPIKAFIIWLVLILWKREADSA